MLMNCVYQKQLQFDAVLMDSWYATKDVMLFIEKLKKVYYCPLKDNRQVDDSGDAQAYGQNKQFHRETKQVTGLEGCQCSKARIVRNHIGCAILVWVQLKRVAQETQRTIYRVKHDLLSDYLRQQLRTHIVKMSLA